MDTEDAPIAHCGYGPTGCVFRTCTCTCDKCFPVDPEEPVPSEDDEGESDEEEVDNEDEDEEVW